MTWTSAPIKSWIQIGKTLGFYAEEVSFIRGSYQSQGGEENSVVITFRNGESFTFLSDTEEQAIEFFQNLSKNLKGEK